MSPVTLVAFLNDQKIVRPGHTTLQRTNCWITSPRRLCGSSLCVHLGTTSSTRNDFLEAIQVRRFCAILVCGIGI